jgi:hypothetical protein
VKESSHDVLRALRTRVLDTRHERRRLGSLTVAVAENRRLESLLLDHVVEIERALVPLLEAAAEPTRQA